VLRAHHPEDRRRRVLAAWNGAELPRRFFPRPTARRKGYDLATSTRAAASATESAFHRRPRPIKGLALHEYGELLGELGD